MAEGIGEQARLLLGRGPPQRKLGQLGYECHVIVHGPYSAPALRQSDVSN